MPTAPAVAVGEVTPVAAPVASVAVVATSVEALAKWTDWVQ